MEENAWAGMIRMGLEEMKEYPIGQRVRIRWGVRLAGVIIEHQPPYGLLAPGYKVRWDDGEETNGFLRSSDLEKIQGDQS